MKKRTAALLASALALAACATPTPPPPQQPVAAPVEQPPEPAEVVLRPFPADAFHDLLVAEFAMRRGRYDLALGNYLQQAHKTRDAGVAARATRLAQFLQTDNAALDAAQLWASLEPDSVEARFSLGSLLARAQRPEEALDEMVAVLKLGGTANFAAIAAGSLQHPPATQDRVLHAFEDLLKQHPDNPDLKTGMALLLQERNQPEAALTLVQEVLREAPEDPHAILIEAGLLQQLERTEEAFERLAQLVQQYPDNIRLRLQYARLLTRTDMEAARVQFRILVQQSPDDADLVLSLGLVNHELGRLDAAETQFQRLLQLDARTQEAYYYLGRIAEERGQDERAIQYYRQIPPSPDFFPAINRATALMAERGDQAGARHYLAGLRDRYPQQAVRLYLTEAQMLLDANALGSAHSLLTEALALHPDQPNLLYMRSLVSERRRDVELVEQDLRIVLEQDPGNAAALNALGYTLANLTQRYEEAYTLIRKALDLRPDDPAILDSMGWVEYRRGNLEVALDYLERAYAAYPDSEVAAHLGEVLWVLGQEERARGIWRSSLEESPDDPILLETIERLTGERP